MGGLGWGLVVLRCVTFVIWVGIVVAEVGWGFIMSSLIWVFVALVWYSFSGFWWV